MSDNPRLSLRRKNISLIDSPTFGRFYFDAVFRTEHAANMTITQHPVQEGAAITDHAYMEPKEVTAEIGMTDTAIGLDAGAAHSVNAYQQLMAIMEEREPITLVTRLNSYDNMLISSIRAPDDYKTMNGLQASIQFQEVQIVSVSTITVQKATSGNKPNKNKKKKKKKRNNGGNGSGGSGGSGGGSSGGGGSGGGGNGSILHDLFGNAKTATKTKTTKSVTKLSSSNKAKVKKKLAG